MVTANLSKYIRERGISMARIAKATGISYQVLTNCFDNRKSRELRADELLLVCNFLDINPYDFMNDTQLA